MKSGSGELNKKQQKKDFLTALVIVNKKDLIMSIKRHSNELKENWGQQLDKI